MKENDEVDEDEEWEEGVGSFAATEEWKIPSLAQQKRLLRREEAHIFYRLSSIVSDSHFALRFKATLSPPSPPSPSPSSHFSKSSLPFLANLRCGLWYLPSFDDTCYFKSTDGHVGTWTFSLARLNLNVIERACEGEGAGCVIVDSTRKGKEFPDRFGRLFVFVRLLLEFYKMNE